MGNKQLYFRFTENNVEGLVTLYEDFAPVTCATIWTALKEPVRVTTMHAMFAGPEIMIGLPPAAQNFDPQSIPAENQTCYPTAGECLWFYQGKNMMYGLRDELWEIGLFYANGGRINGPLGWTPCNIFGRMTQNLENFAAECADIRLTGAKTIEIGRWLER
jgi:Protein of unknown function (DUF3830)